MEQLGCLQLRWQSWGPLISRAKQTGFCWESSDPFWMPAVPRHCFSLLTSKRALTLWTTPVIQWGRSREGLGSEHTSQPHYYSSIVIKSRMRSHSLCSPHGVLLSASNFHPASDCQCWDTTEMVIRFAPKPPWPLCPAASPFAVRLGKFPLQGHHSCLSALGVCGGRLMTEQQLFGRTHGPGQSVFLIHCFSNSLVMERVF